jgi:HEAT repeat protein
MNEEDVRRLLEAAMGTNIDARNHAIEELARHEFVEVDAKHAVPALIEVFSDTHADPYLRRDAALVIGKLGGQSQDAVPALTKSLLEPHGIATEGAIWALGNIRDPASIQPLLDACVRGDLETAGQVETALAAFGTDVVPDMVSALDDALEALERDEYGLSDGLFLCSSGVFRRLGDPAVPFILAALDQQPDRTAAIVALEGVGANAQKAVPRLIDAIENAELRPWAISALRSIGPGAAAAVPTLIAVLVDSEGHIRLETIRALGEIGPDAKAAIPYLRQLRDTDSEEVKRAVDHALHLIEKP